MHLGFETGTFKMIRQASQPGRAAKAERSQCGDANTSAFASAFLRQVGTTPSRYPRARVTFVVPMFFVDLGNPDRLREVYELSESGKMIGKIVLPGIDG